MLGLDGILSTIKAATQVLSSLNQTISNSVLFQNAPGTVTTLGNATTGTGPDIVLQNAPTVNSPLLVTPNIGVATGTSLALSGAAAGPLTTTTGTGTVVVMQTSPVLLSPTLGVQQTTQGKLILANTAAGAFAITLQSSNSATAAWTLTLPVAAPGTNGFMLTATTAGVASWVVPVTGPGSAVSGNILSFNGTTGVVYQDSGVATSSLGTAAALVGGTMGAAVGYRATEFNAGTFSSGTYTPTTANGNFQYATNNGAHTLAGPTGPCTMVIEYTNGASAGTITPSGFTKQAGDSFDTVNGHKFACFITVMQNYTLLTVQALQ